MSCPRERASPTALRVSAAAASRTWQATAEATGSSAVR